MKKDKISKFEPQKLIDIIKESKDSIFVLGNIGSGKTTIINEMVKSKDNDCVLVNASINNGEYLILRDNDVYRLYHICLILQKIINKLENNYDPEIAKLEVFIDFLMKKIMLIYSSDGYDNKEKYLHPSFLKNPESLIEIFKSKVDGNLQNKLAIIIDDFDKVEHSSQRYQNFIYEIIRKHFKLVMTISDINVINNEKIIEKLNSSNTIVNLEYSKDVPTVKDILGKKLRDVLDTNNSDLFQKEINFLLTDHFLLEMIQVAQGNLSVMLSAINSLKKLNLDIFEYQSYLLDYIDKKINLDPVISGITQNNRSFHIK